MRLTITPLIHPILRAKRPQSNGICERFHKTMQDEFYSIAFRKKLYYTLDQLQDDLDAWLEDYNTVRTHSGRYCYGKTPMQTMQDAKHLSQEKILDNQVEDTLQPAAA